MSDTLKVLMMGGRRCGKTSVLAGLVNAMVNGEIHNLLTIEDKTVLMPGQESLSKKRNSLESALKEKKGRVFLVDDSRTSTFTTYTLQVKVPDTNSCMTIEFKDANGEFSESKSSYADPSVSKQTIVDAITESDVYIIAIDTPYLMEAVNPDNSLCSEAVNSTHNHIGDIQNLLTNISDSAGANPKLVLFVPVKCEKWAHEIRLDMVTERVKQAYKTIIQNLESYSNIEVDILPVQTVGSIEFKEHKTAYLCSSPEMKGAKCCLLNNNILRFSDGSERNILPSDIINEDPEARISEFHKIIRPYSWFCVTGSVYSPRNCEQLAYYILRFVMGKYLFLNKAKEQKAEKQGTWARIAGIVAGLVALPFNLPVGVMLIVAFCKISIGTFSYKQLERIIRTINEKKLLKHDEEGIQCIKQSLLDFTCTTMI